MDLGAGAGQIHFYRSLGNAAHSAVPLTKALDVLAKGSTGFDPAIVRELGSRLDQGQALSQSMREHSSVFPSWQSELVAIGEATGRLDSSFLDIARLLEERRSFVMTLASGLAYPLFMVHVAPFLLFGGKLVSDGLLSYGLAVAAFLSCLYLPVGAGVWAFRAGIFSSRSVPVIGELLPKMQFCSFVAGMLRATVPVGRALELSATASGLAAPEAPSQPGEPLLESIRRYGIFSAEELARL